MRFAAVVVVLIVTIGAIPFAVYAQADRPQGATEHDSGTSGSDGSTQSEDGDGATYDQYQASAEQRRQAYRCQRAFESGNYSSDAPPGPDDPCHRYYEHWQMHHNETAARREAARQEAATRERRDAYQDSWSGGDEALWKLRVDEARRSHDKLQRVPEDLRDRVGAIIPDATGYHGTFISFIPDRSDHTLSNVTLAGTPIFVSIQMPGRADAATTHVAGNLLRIDGNAWRYHLVDSPAAVMVFHEAAIDRTFRLEIPVGTDVAWHTRGATLTYDAPGGGTLTATLRGDVAPGDTATTLVIDGEARFIAEAARVLPAKAPAHVASDLDDAARDGRLGAEVALLRGAPSTAGARPAIIDETVLYADLAVTVEETTADGAPSFAITLDSDTEPGKTIAVAFEHGMIDTDDLLIRYYNVDDERVIEAPVVAADSLADVLDPLDDGVVAEYHLVTDATGAHLLLSVPHFSVHRFEVSSIGAAVLEQPSLLFGIVGAGVLVAVAAVAMMRRPRS